MKWKVENIKVEKDHIVGYDASEEVGQRICDLLPQFLEKQVCKLCECYIVDIRNKKYNVLTSIPLDADDFKKANSYTKELDKTSEDRIACKWTLAAHVSPYHDLNKEESYCYIGSADLVSAD